MPDPSPVPGFLAGEPALVAAMVLAVALVAARALRFLVARGLTLLDRTLVRVDGMRAEVVPERAITALAAFAFWGTLAVGVLLAVRILGAGRIVDWVDAPLAHLPAILVGLAIIAAGHVLGIVARDLVRRVQEPGDDTLTPRLVQGAVFLVGVMTGLQHMGLDVSFLAQLLILVVGVCLAGLSLAFALGAREYVANLLARSATGRYRPGDRLQVDDIEGTVVAVHAMGVELSTPAGVVTIPAARFLVGPVLRLDPGDAGDPGADEVRP